MAIKLLQTDRGSGAGMTIDALYYQRKLEQCRRLIEQCGAYYHDTQDSIYLRIAKESEQDAVYWQAMAAGNGHYSASEMAYGKSK